MSVQEPTSSLAADDSFGDFDGATEGPSDPQPASAEPAPAAGSSAPAATAVPAAADDDDDDFGDFDAAPTTAAPVTSSQPPAAAAAAPAAPPAAAIAAPGGGQVPAAAPKPAPPPSSSGTALHADPWKVLATPAPAPATAAAAQQLILQHSQRPPLADLSLDSCNGAPVLLQVFQPSQQPGAAPAAVWQPADVECPYPVEWLGGAAEQRVLASIGLAQAAAKLRAAQQASMAAGR